MVKISITTPNAEKIFNLLIELYEKQEGVKIKYSLVKKGEEEKDGYKVNS